MAEVRQIGKFSSERATRAAPSAVWRLWTDPATWAQWDRGLKRAETDQPLTLGVTGTIIPLSGPQARFKVIGWVEGESYRFATRLPLASLVVDRGFISMEPVRFKHTLWFEGPLARLWSALLGQRFRAELPPTVAALAGLAEAEDRH